MSFDTTVQTWIMETTGYDDQHVVRAESRGPRPSGDHAVYMDIASIRSQFSEATETDEGIPDDDLLRSYRAPKQITYAVSIFAADGRELLDALFQSRYLLVSRLLLRDGNLVLRAIGQTNQVPTQGDTSWRRQYNADFAFGTYQRSSELNQKILEIELHGEFDPDLPVVIEGTV